MTHISSIGAGLYSDLSVCRETWSATPTSAATWAALFLTPLANGSAVTGATGEFTRVENIRSFPEMGTPPNIVNVPVYGSKTSRQVQGQADSPSFEVELNFIPSDWVTTANYLGNLVGDGNLYGFRFALLNALPSGTWASTTTTGLGAAGVENSLWYWGGKLEALQINPQLTDSNTAKLTISIQTNFYGPYTAAA